MSKIITDELIEKKLKEKVKNDKKVFTEVTNVKRKFKFAVKTIKVPVLKDGKPVLDKKKKPKTKKVALYGSKNFKLYGLEIVLDDNKENKEDITGNTTRIEQYQRPATSTDVPRGAVDVRERVS